MKRCRSAAVPVLLTSPVGQSPYLLPMHAWFMSFSRGVMSSSSESEQALKVILLIFPSHCMMCILKIVPSHSMMCILKIVYFSCLWALLNSLFLFLLSYFSFLREQQEVYFSWMHWIDRLSNEEAWRERPTTSWLCCSCQPQHWVKYIYSISWHRHCLSVTVSVPFSFPSSACIMSVTG